MQQFFIHFIFYTQVYAQLVCFTILHYTPKYIRGEVMLDWQVYWVIMREKKMQRNFNEGVMWTRFCLSCCLIWEWTGKELFFNKRSEVSQKTSNRQLGTFRCWNLAPTLTIIHVRRSLSDLDSSYLIFTCFLSKFGMHHMTQTCTKHIFLRILSKNVIVTEKKVQNTHS